MSGDIIKVQLTPKFLLLLMKTTIFLYYFSEKIISINKIPPILQAFNVVISCPTSEYGGIWVGPLLTSSKDIAQKTQETFDGVSSAYRGEAAVTQAIGVFVFHTSSKLDKTSNERGISSSNTIQGRI